MVNIAVNEENTDDRRDRSASTALDIVNNLKTKSEAVSNARSESDPPDPSINPHVLSEEQLKSKMYKWAHSSRLLKSTEVAGLQYIGQADYTIEIYVWLFCLLIFTLLCAVHLTYTLQSYDTGALTKYSIAITTEETYKNVTEAHKFLFCVQNIWSIPEYKQMPLDIQIMSYTVEEFYKPNNISFQDYMDEEGGLDQFLVSKGEKSKLFNGERPTVNLFELYPDGRILLDAKKINYVPILLAARRYIQAMSMVENHVAQVSMTVDPFTLTKDEVFLNLLLNENERITHNTPRPVDFNLPDHVFKQFYKIDRADYPSKIIEDTQIRNAFNYVLDFAEWFETADYKGDDRWADLLYTYSVHMFSNRIDLTVYNEYLAAIGFQKAIGLEAELMSIDLNTECYRFNLSIAQMDHLKFNEKAPENAKYDTEFLLFEYYVMPSAFDYDRMIKMKITAEVFQANISEFRAKYSRWYMIHDNHQPLRSVFSDKMYRFDTKSTGTINVLQETNLLLNCTAPELHNDSVNCERECRRKNLTALMECATLFPTVQKNNSYSQCLLSDYDNRTLELYLPTIVGGQTRHKIPRSKKDYKMDGEKECLKKCSYLPPCQFTTYDLGISSLSLDDEYDKIQITFKYAIGRMYQVVEQEWTWTWYDWLADVGGVLELWLGAGLLGLIHLVVHFVKSLNEKYHQYNSGPINNQ